MNALDLSLETLDDIEAPLTDTEWGIIAGVAFGAGLWIGIAVT